MFLSSTLLTLIPQGSVATSNSVRILALIVSLEVRVSSSSRSPTIFLSVVAVKDLIATIGFSTP